MRSKIRFYSDKSLIDPEIMAEPTRVHHPPDQIINGKPKWTEIIVNKQNEATELNIDRLNPSRNMLEEIESACEERAEDTQKVLVNMMSDLKCELLVTLGDAKLDLATEQKFMEKHNEWENYKVCNSFMINDKCFINHQL